jgi:hypothetical protein
MRLKDRIHAEANLWMCLRERGKIVPGSLREGHNVFTIAGRNWLSKLCGWRVIASTDEPYTERRVRWIGVGTGGLLEVTTVSALNVPTLATTTQYIVPVQSAEFPSSTSVRFIKEFGTSEITPTGTPVTVTEAGLFVDVNPAAGSPTEDIAVGGGYNTTLSPLASTNPPVAYKAFEGLTKTVDFTLEVRWDFRF